MKNKNLYVKPELINDKINTYDLMTASGEQDPDLQERENSINAFNSIFNWRG